MCFTKAYKMNLQKEMKLSCYSQLISCFDLF